LIEDLLGLASSDLIDQILDTVNNHDLKKLTEVLDRANNEGVDTAILVSQLSNKVMELIPNNPELISLLDSLIDVPKSPRPQLKLLSVLGTATSTKSQPKTAALKTPVLEVSASIKELEKQAVKEKPSERNLADKKINKPDQKVTNKKIANSDFDWNTLIDYTKKNHIALHSVLSKCGYEVSGNKLTLYTCNNFYKKKLDDTKYAPLLSKCLQEIGCDYLDVHTIPTAPPPKDSQAAAVAAIMGGGVEVALEAS
jgi:hypothetical protein